MSLAGFSTVSVYDAPLPGASGRHFRVPAGVRIADIVCPDTSGAMVRLDGAWLLRRDWARPLMVGDHVDVVIVPLGSDGGRKALATVLTVVATAVLGPGGAAGLTGIQSAAAVIAATIAINIVLGPNPAAALAGGGSESPAYSTSLQGNRAAPYEPIPVLYGRNRTFPPFASEPYLEYDDSNDQYYHALLAIGMGEYTIERVMLDDTDLNHFVDVDFAILAPGEAPTLVEANVVTAVEVSGQPLTPGRFVGGFAACAPRQLVSEIGIDVICERGLADATGGSPSSHSVDIRVDVRTIDDWGVNSTNWTVLASETITAASTQPVRRSFRYSIGTPRRVEVRMWRTDSRNDDPLVLNDVSWGGLRAYLDAAAPLAASATHLEVRMRASEQLNGLSQRRLAVISRRLLRTWDTVEGWSEELVFTRNPGWALADKWSNAEYGDGLPDSRMDLATLRAIITVWDTRQDHFDYVFDTAMDSDSADQLIARAGRARCFWRQGIRTLVRDQAQPLPIAGYSSRDMAPGSLRVDYAVDASEIPDAIIVEYWDLRAWDWRSVTCPAPGVALEDVERPEYMRLLGVTGSKQAEREGLYEAARRALGRITASFTTELQGLIPTYGSAVVVAPALGGWGASGDVVGWVAGTLTATLSEPVDWQPSGTHYITLWAPDGTVTVPIEVVEGATAYEAVLQASPGFTLVVDDGTQERPRYVLTLPTEQPRRVHKVLGVRPRAMDDDGMTLVEISTMQDDDAVHEADNALLPGVGETQDPIDSPTTAPTPPGGDPGDPGGPTAADYLVRLTNHEYITGGTDYTGGWPASLTINPDGSVVVELDAFAGGTVEIDDEYLVGHPFTPAPGVLFEVYVTVLSGDPPTGGTFDTWLSLASAQTWDFEPASPIGEFSSWTIVRVFVRDADTAVIQDQGDFSFNWFNVNGGAP